MRRVLLAAAAMAMVALWARGAGAVMGGPDVADVLGWDSKLHRVYVAIVHLDGDEYSPTVWYFDLRGERPAAPHWLDWSGGEEDEVYAARLAKLRRGLRPLRAAERTRSVMDADVREAPAVWDSVDSDAGHSNRYADRLESEPGSGAFMRVLTLDPGRHAVRRLREYALPRSSATLAILSCEAIPMGPGYEVQFPVLFGAGPGTSDPVDPRAFDVRR